MPRIVGEEKTKDELNQQALDDIQSGVARNVSAEDIRVQWLDTYASFDNLVITAINEAITAGTLSGGIGENGWSPQLALESDGERRVLRITGWTGGTGTAPTETGYLGSTGIISDISLATDIRGPAGTGANIDQTTIDNRVRAIVENWAEAGNSTLIPVSKVDGLQAEIAKIAQNETDISANTINITANAENINHLQNQSPTAPAYEDLVIDFYTNYYSRPNVTITSRQLSPGINKYFSFLGDETPYSGTNTDGVIISAGLTRTGEQSWVSGFDSPTDGGEEGTGLWGKTHWGHDSFNANVNYVILGDRHTDNLPYPLVRINNGSLQYNTTGSRDTQDWQPVRDATHGNITFVNNMPVDVIMEYHIHDTGSERSSTFRRNIEVVISTNQGSQQTHTQTDDNNVYIFNDDLLLTTIESEIAGTGNRVQIWQGGGYLSHSALHRLITHNTERLLGLMINQVHSQTRHRFTGASEFQEIYLGTGETAIRLDPANFVQHTDEGETSHINQFIKDYAQTGSTDKIPLEEFDKEGATNGQAIVWNETDNKWEPGTVTSNEGGLTQDQVDARVQAGVQDWAEASNTGTIPLIKFPTSIARASSVTALERGTEYHTDASGPVTVTVAEQDANVRHDFTILPTGSRVNFQYSSNPRLVEVWSQNQINLYSSTDVDGSDTISHAANTVVIYRVEQGGIFKHAERVGDRSILRGGYTLSALRNNVDFERTDQFIYRENTAQPLLVRADADFTTDSSTAAPSTTINGTSGNFTTIGLLWTASSTGGSFDESADYRLTGNWDYEGEINKDGVPLITADDIPAVTFQKAYWDGGGDLRDSRYSTPAANVSTANSGTSPTNTFVADTGSYTSGVSIVNGVLRDTRTTTRKVIIPNWIAEDNVDFSLAHLSCTFQHNVGSYQVAFYYGQDQSYRNGTGTDIMRDLTGIDSGILFGIWSGGSAGASKTMWCVNAKTGQYLQFPGNAASLSNKSNLSWSTNGTFTEIIPSAQSTASGLTEAYNFGSPNKFEVFQIKSQLIVRLNGMTLINGYLPNTQSIAHDLSGRNFGLVMTRVTSGSSTNEVHQVIVEDISSNLVLNDNNGATTFLDLTDTPSAFTGENYYRANQGATALEARSPAHVLQDIGAQASVPNLTDRISPAITSNTNQRKLVIAPNATVVSLADDTDGGSTTTGPATLMELHSSNYPLTSSNQFVIGTTSWTIPEEDKLLLIQVNDTVFTNQNNLGQIITTTTFLRSLTATSSGEFVVGGSTHYIKFLGPETSLDTTINQYYIARDASNRLLFAGRNSGDPAMPLKVFEINAPAGPQGIPGTAPTPSDNLVTSVAANNSFILPTDFNTTYNTLTVIYAIGISETQVRHVAIPTGFIATVTTGTQSFRMQGGDAMIYTASTRTFSLNAPLHVFRYAQLS